MKTWIFFIVSTVLFYSCKSSPKKNQSETEPENAFGIGFRNGCVSAKKIDSSESLFTLDSTGVQEFAGDTAAQISKTLDLMSAIDQKASKVAKDSFDVFEQTSKRFFKTHYPKLNT